MILYHGTTKRALKKILKEGLKPRGDNKSNWDSGIGKSRKNLVYLTSCYACYYASMACKKSGDIPIILKIELDPKNIILYPDEEFIFNLKEKNGISREKAIKIYESIDPIKESKRIRWDISLEFMGTVSAKKIPIENIISYAEGNGMEFLMNCDPSISPINYKYCSENYIKYLESLNYINL